MIATLTQRPPAISGNTVKRAVIYCRISRDLTGEGRGVERQEDACRALAASRGWQVDAIVVENDTSASKGKRRKYTRMLADASAGHYDVIISWAVDRLTRSPREIEDLTTMAEQTGVMVATVSGDLDLTTDQGRLVGRILGSVARGEVERKGARQRAAYRQSAESGKPPNGPAFGYRSSGEIVPDEAAMVRDMFDRFAAGAGIKTLTDWLNAQGVTNTKGKRWSRYGVRWLLMNPRYIGERWQQHRTPDGKLTHEYVTQGKWEPIVAEDVFRQVGSILADPARTTTPGPNRRWLGSGLYECGVCGARLQVYYQNYKNSDLTQRVGRRYRCGKTFHLVRKADDIDVYVRQEVLRYLQETDLAELMIDDRDSSVVASLNDEAAELRRRIDRAEKDYADGNIDARMLTITKDRNHPRLAAILAQLSRYGERSPLALVAGKADPGAAWLELDVVSQCKVVDACMGIVVMPGKRGRGAFDTNTIRIVTPVRQSHDDTDD